MKTTPTPNAISYCPLKTIIRAGVFILLAFVALPLFSASSANFSEGLLQKSLAGMTRGIGTNLENSSRRTVDSNYHQLLTVPTPVMELLLALPQAGTEAVTIYQSDCTTPATAFNLAQTVCAKITDAPLPVRPTRPQRRLVFVNPAGFVVAEADVTTETQTMTFQLPATGTSTFGNVTIDNRGSWQVIGVWPADGTVKTSAWFSVRDPQQAVADLSITASTLGPEEVAADSNVSFNLLVTNYGPDAASAVSITDAVPVNTTLVSVVQNSGPEFACQTTGMTPTTTCTINSLPRGAEAKFTLTYHVGAGLPAKTLIINQADISTTTFQAATLDNSSRAAAIVTGEAAGGGGCTLVCPTDVVVNADTTQGTESGAFVTYSAAGVTGDCGSVSNSPGSGSFFAVGTHTITSTASEGGSCTFTVTVLDSAPPTISCPADITVTAPANSDEANVTITPPTFTPLSGTLNGERSDNSVAVPRSLSDPYPVGVTGIFWTVTGESGRTASCKQSITVRGNLCGDDTTNPTILAPDDVTFSTGPRNTGCTVSLDDELGQADASDNCSVGVTISISGMPAGNAFAPGTYTLTYTATDGSGNTASDTQVVTVVDDTLPNIEAPADASYTCMSEVPAASASQATRGDVFDENGNLLPPGPPSDNCGVPTVGVTESSTGAGSAADPKVITRVFTATDGAGNSASDTQIITVIDSVAPTIADPADVSVNTGSGAMSCDTTVTLTAPAADDNCAGVTVTSNHPGDTFPVGTTEVVWTATDAAGNTATVSQNVTVTDNTAPTITAPADKTLYTGAEATSCDVTVGDLNATLGTANAADNCPGVTWARDGGNVFPLGENIVTYTATDAHGNTASATQKVTVVDNTPPVVTPPANITVYLPLNSTATSMAVSYPNPATATDNCAGTITFSYGPASGSTFSVGTTTVTVTATDAHNNSASATFTVTVLYNFTGFLSPVNNSPVLNSVNAGRAIPVKFSLSGNKGMDIFAANNPYSVSLNCNTNDPGVDVTETLTAGGSSLNYSPDQYIYVWKTETSWAGTCRQLVVTLNDGSVHTANFKFK